MNRFNSKVCTSAKQSKRLLELGLNPKTADMYLFDNMGIHTAGVVGGVENNATLAFREPKIPAWSLHRLIELLPQDIHLDDYADTHYYLTIDPFKVIYVNSHRLWIHQSNEGCLYDKLIDAIEWTIKNNFFNKEYLKQ